MIPLVDVVSIREDSKIQEATRQMKQSGFSRYPVYAFRVDHIGGWINHFDLLRIRDSKESIHKYIRELHFLPQNIFLGKLLLEMKKKGDRIVMLVDEYGGVVGMVTLEDILEEVVGDIEDEYDNNSSQFRTVNEGEYIVQANMSIEAINEAMKLSIAKGDYETLGGFLLQQFNRIPEIGDELYLGDLKFIVLKASNRAIQTVQITRL